MFSEAESESVKMYILNSYISGMSIPDIVRESGILNKMAPNQLMVAFMNAFRLGLSEVSIIDGWWPERLSSIPEDKLDCFLRDAIELNRASWEEYL